MAVLTPELFDFDSSAVRRRSKAPTSEMRFFSRKARFSGITRKVSSNSIHTLLLADADKKHLMITRLPIEICIRRLVVALQHWYVPTDLHTDIRTYNNNDGQVDPARRYF